MEGSSHGHSPLIFGAADFQFVEPIPMDMSPLHDDEEQRDHHMEEHDVEELLAQDVFETSTQPAPVVTTKDTTPEDESPEVVLQRAIMLEEPFLNFPIKRMKGKQAACLTSVCLHRLRMDVKKSCGFPVVGNREIFDKGRWTYIRACQRLFGGKASRDNRLKAFAGASLAVRQNYVFLDHLWGKLYNTTRKQGVPIEVRNWQAARIPLPNGKRYVETEETTATVRETWGMLLTVHSTVGLGNSEMIRAVEQGLRGDQLLAIMKDMPDYTQEFGVWTEFIRKTTEKLGFTSWATCMELGTATGKAISVHVHAFLGPEVRTSACWGRSNAPQQLRVRPADLSYKGEEMFVSYMRPFGAKHVWTLSCCGLYYLRGPKVGGLFHTGNREPFQDCRPEFIFYFNIE